MGMIDGEIIRADADPSTRDRSEGWRLYTEEDGLVIGHSPRIVQTRDNVIWTASGHGLKGVNRFDGKAWSTVNLRTMGGVTITTIPYWRSKTGFCGSEATRVTCTPIETVRGESIIPLVCRFRRSILMVC